MKYRSERAIKDAGKKILKDLPIWYYMPAASVYGRRGVPDFVCCLRGRFIGIEAKREDVGAKGLSPMQVVESRGILSAGGEYMVVWDDETLQSMQKRLWTLSDKGRNNV